MTSIKKELIGTWKLLSYIEVPTEGEDSLFPMGKHPRGVLMYSSDGYMTIQISRGERSHAERNDKTVATPEEMISPRQGSIVFSGKYTVDSAKAIVTYGIESSLFPNRESQLQRRRVDFEGNILYLKSTEPILSNGIYVNSYMTWKRVEGSVDAGSVDERFLRMASLED